MHWKTVLHRAQRVHPALLTLVCLASGGLLIYALGLYMMAMGVVFSARSSLGVSPVGSPANVLYQIGLHMGLDESLFNLGNWTIATYCVYILMQIVMLGKNFKPIQLLQLAISFAFGWLVNLTTAMVSGLPTPTNYGIQLLYLLGLL